MEKIKSTSLKLGVQGNIIEISRNIFMTVRFVGLEQTENKREV